MAENNTDHMLNIANFVSQILPQQQYLSQQQMDGYKSAFTADVYCVENKTFSSRECRGEKYRFARTFRLVENRLKSKHGKTKER